MNFANQKVYGVRLYPSGGLICQTVQRRELMHISRAILCLSNNKPALIPLHDLSHFKAVWTAHLETNKMRRGRRPPLRMIRVDGVRLPYVNGATR